MTMIKTFEDQNHYDILKISPGADISELKRAYRDVLALYDNESLATYALFSDEERTELLQAIEAAYQTLMDDNKRTAYNQMLLDTGQVDASFFSLKDQKHLAARGEGESWSDSLAAWVRKKKGQAEINAQVDALMAKSEVSGAELRALREALGIEKGEIYKIAKISGTVLTNIEEDRYTELPEDLFLKQFLSSYAEILQVDPLHVVSGYLRHMAAGS